MGFFFFWCFVVGLLGGQFGGPTEDVRGDGRWRWDGL